MTKQEAIEWLEGNNSTLNCIPRDPIDSWQVRIAQADAAYVQQAYWILKAHSEELLNQKIELSQIKIEQGYKTKIKPRPFFK